MNIFKWLQKKTLLAAPANKPETPANKPETIETQQICRNCGASNKINDRFCPQCGASLSENSVSPNTNTKMLSSDETAEKKAVISDATSAYLEELGLLHLANQVFTITIKIDRRYVALELLGWQNSADAIRKLRETGYLPQGGYLFKDWPKAQPAFGPGRRQISACVCELPTRTLHIEKDDSWTHMPVLYGCPNAKSMDYSALHRRMRLEVVDYEQN